jgi:hypothetical protein
VAIFIVNKVRQEDSSDRSHRHIAGVCTTAGTYYTRKQVVDSINAGNYWKSEADGYSATITVMSYCPKAGCMAAPYIKTNADSTKKDNLDNLDSC